MNIKAHSRYDWETVKKFYAFSFSKKQRWPNVVLIVTFILLVFSYGLQIVNRTFTSDLLPSLIMFAVLYLIVGYIRFVLPKVRYNKNKLIHEIENTFVFTENQFEISQSGESTAGAATINYDAVYKIYETKEFIYIYITQNQAHFVDKSTITGGTATDLRVFLMKEVGTSKYKIRFKV